MRNRILLIRPPTVMKGTSFIATQFPLNIASIAANLLKSGYDVRIWDFDVEPFNEGIFKARLESFDPFIVGISCYTPTVINGHRIATLTKEFLSDVSVIVGGPHVSALPKETLNEFKNFDIGVRGEGEEVVLELADKLSSGSGIESISGIVYKKNGAPCVTEKRAAIKNLDSLLPPARHLLNIALYKGQSHRGFSREFLKITEIMTSRGCPNQCIFCASEVVMGRGVRFISADSIKKEIGECVERFEFKHFAISDDTFILREDRLHTICEEFRRRKLTWNCNARVWPLSRKTIFAMARSGCRGITFGVESGSPRILKLIKKGVTLEQIENAFRWAKEAGIKFVEADVIIGSHPSETEEDIRMTRKLLRRISPDVAMISVIVPYPGTEVYNIMKEKNLIRENKSWDSFVFFGKEPLWQTENFTPKKLISIQRRMLIEFYFRPLYMLRIIGKMKTMTEAIYWLRGGIDFLFGSLRKKRRSS
ncbi:MAG: B12-binding domain-containing radical SAM protein [Omnitrophica bacterium]|nr:B12-binding domain-containing radical SAM protein [Candidatus Omnitrophota bacterium]